ncbi:MAG: ribose 5-phosphate isomerase B [Bacteroidota bacterium]
MTVAIACDHAGFRLKQVLLEGLQKEGCEVLDLGAYDEEPSDYPDWARSVGAAILQGRAQKGILVCGSGIGASIAANKMRGIRAGVSHDTYSAHQGVEHDDMNVLCLGARVVGPAPALEIAAAFLKARFSGEERHRRRLDKIRALEAPDAGGSAP